MAVLETSSPPEPMLHASLTLAGKPKEIDGPFILVSILDKDGFHKQCQLPSGTVLQFVMSHFWEKKKKARFFGEPQ